MNSIQPLRAWWWTCGYSCPASSRFYSTSRRPQTVFQRPSISKLSSDRCWRKLDLMLVTRRVFDLRPTSCSFTNYWRASSAGQILQAFLDCNRLITSTQSSYRKFHNNNNKKKNECHSNIIVDRLQDCTETAVMRVYNDLLLATEGSGVCPLSDWSDGGFWHCRSWADSACVERP